MLVNRCLLPLLLLALFQWPASSRGDLLTYVRRPEPKFSWQLRGKTPTPAGTIFDIHLVSQEWHDIVWTHQLEVYVPKDVKPRKGMLLFITGGKADANQAAFGFDLAKRINAPVAILFQIPNQPLLDGKKEDELIAETFVRFLETKDDTWPLLLPMTKSAVKAMDALQAFAKDEWKQPVEDFVVTGASKRGWTTWLTGAVDPRVKAIAPMVIDVLNMREQIPHQKASLGAYSDMIHDYTERNLVPLPDSPPARQLWGMVDPYSYRERIEQPKLLILGNNDAYWSTDALNLYWDGLRGPKFVTYVPNAGHDLREGEKDDKRTRAVSALCAFARLTLEGARLPKVAWSNVDDKGKPGIKLSADPTIKAARLWKASAPTQDFRNATWTATELAIAEHTVIGSVTPTSKGFIAFYLDVDYEVPGMTWHVCSQLRVVGAAAAQR